MKDNIYFMDQYFLEAGVPFSYPPGQVGPMLLWFKCHDFKKILEVCQRKQLGVSVIEVYKGGYADTLLAEDFGDNPFDPAWYNEQYENLVKEYCEDAAEVPVLFAGIYLEQE